MTVLDVSVTWAGLPSRLSGGGIEMRTKRMGGHSDASAAPVGKRARGRRARRAGGRDGGGGSGRTVSPRAQRPRGGPEGWGDTTGQWLHRLSDPPQYARWRHQRRALGLGRVRNRLRRPPWHRVLRAPENQGVHRGGGVSWENPTHLCPDGARHAGPDPPDQYGRWALRRRGWAGVSVCLHPPDQRLGSEHDQYPVPRPAGRRHGPAQGSKN